MPFAVAFTGNAAQLHQALAGENTVWEFADGERLVPAGIVAYLRKKYSEPDENGVTLFTPEGEPTEAMRADLRGAEYQKFFQAVQAEMAEERTAHWLSKDRLLGLIKNRPKMIWHLLTKS